jgi:streptomycin 3"-adenylyltransferase
MNNIYGWADCPENIRKKVEGIVAFYRQSLGKNLIGIYLHGSLTMGCFNPNLSDIDFLAIVTNKLTTDEKKVIIDYLLAVDNGSQATSPEMSIITLDSLTNFRYPTPFELFYDHAWHERYTEGKVDLEEQRFDDDLAMHYINIRERGICLYGKPIQEVIPIIPRDIRLTFVGYDLRWIEERLDTLPISYIVLNPCRAIAFLKEDKYMSKKEGGEWALSHLPTRFSGIIGQALAAYTAADEPPHPEAGDIKDFYEYAKKELQQIISLKTTK